MRLPIDLWRIGLSGEPTSAGATLLDAREIERAERLKFEADRQRFWRVHIAVRQILAEYAGLPPQALRFEVGAHGKPRLADGGAPAFNLSDSEDLALLAVYPVSTVDLGVDIEKKRPLSDSAALAARYFSADEQCELQKLETVAGRDAAFLDCWTRKEAYVKALGRGLADSELREMQVGLRGRVRIGRIVIDSLEIAGGYAAAIACSADVGSVNYRDFQTSTGARHPLRQDIA